MSSAQSLLKKHIKTEQIGGETVRLQKLGAAGYVKVKAYLLSVKVNEKNIPVNEDESVAFAALVLSKTLVNESGELDCDTNEGRKTLADIPLPELQDLSMRSLQWSGLAAEIEEPSKN